jgi:hypothetical protein
VVVRTCSANAAAARGNPNAGAHFTAQSEQNPWRSVWRFLMTPGSPLWNLRDFEIPSDKSVGILLGIFEKCPQGVFDNIPSKDTRESV